MFFLPLPVITTLLLTQSTTACSSPRLSAHGAPAWCGCKPNTTSLPRLTLLPTGQSCGSVLTLIKSILNFNLVRFEVTVVSCLWGNHDACFQTRFMRTKQMPHLDWLRHTIWPTAIKSEKKCKCLRRCYSVYNWPSLLNCCITHGFLSTQPYILQTASSFKKEHENKFRNSEICQADRF